MLLVAFSNVIEPKTMIFNFCFRPLKSVFYFIIKKCLINYNCFTETSLLNIDIYIVFKKILSLLQKESNAFIIKAGESFFYNFEDTIIFNAKNI